MAIRPLLHFVVCAVLLLCGCQGDLPSTTDATEADVSRDATGLYGGRVTLNGSATTDPSYKDQPYVVTIPGKAGEIALITLTATAIPTANHPVLVRFRGATVNYGSMLYPTDGTTNYLPLYLTQTEPLTITLYNTAAGAPYPEAVNWSWSIRTRAAEDSREPNDNENELSITDRNLATPLALRQATPFSVYRRVAVPATQDHEDWYRMNLVGTSSVHINFASTNGQWGTWRYDLRIFDANGALLATQLDITTNGNAWTTPPLSGIVYLQVVATPLSKRGNSVYFGQYTLTPTPQSGWQSHQVVTGEIVDVDLSVIGGRPALAWSTGSQFGANPVHFARALSPAPQSASDWVSYQVSDGTHWIRGRAGVRLLEHGGRAWIFSRWVWYANTTSPNSATDWQLSHQLFGDVSTEVSVVVEANRMLTAFGNSLAESIVAVPSSGSDWRQHIPMDNIAEIGALALKDGRPAILLDTIPGDDDPDEFWFARSLVTSPQSPTDWVSQRLRSGSDVTHVSSSEQDLTVFNGRYVILNSRFWDPEGGAGCHEAVENALYSALVDEPSSIADWETEVLSGFDCFASDTSTNFVQKAGNLYFLLQPEGQEWDERHAHRTTDPLSAPFETLPVPTIRSYRHGLDILDGHLIYVGGAAEEALTYYYEVSGW